MWWDIAFTLPHSYTHGKGIFHIYALCKWGCVLGMELGWFVETFYVPISSAQEFQFLL